MKKNEINISFKDLFSNYTKHLTPNMDELKEENPIKPENAKINKIFPPILFAIASVIAVSSVVLFKDYTTVYKQGHTNLVFSPTTSYLNKTEINHLDNRTDAFIKRYEDMKTVGLQNNGPINYLLLFGDLSVSAMDTTYEGSLYYAYNKDNQLAFKEANKKEYFASDIYKQNQEKQRLYFKELLTSLEQSDKKLELTNISPLGEYVFESLLKQSDEFMYEKTLRSAYDAYYRIEYAKEIHAFYDLPNFDFVKLASLSNMTNDEMSQYWKDNFASVLGVEEVPEYIKAITLKDILDIEIIKEKINSLTKSYQSSIQA